MSPTPPRIERYGWRPSRPDPRDWVYGVEDALRPEFRLPSSYDLREEMPEVYDQGQLGSCTANADGAILEHAQMAQGEHAATPSRLFLYYEERRLGGLPLDQDTGAEVRDGIKVAASEGVPREADWPYDVSKFADRPPQSAYDDAVAYEALEYKSIIVGAPGAPMRNAIAAHHPIAFGFPVPDYFEDPSRWDPASGTPLPLPDQSTQIIGGHAVVIVGYDFTGRDFAPHWIVRNSWGPGWGDAGHFRMFYEWFDPRRNLATDLWIITRVK